MHEDHPDTESLQFVEDATLIGRGFREGHGWIPATGESQAGHVVEQHDVGRIPVGDRGCRGRGPHEILGLGESVEDLEDSQSNLVFAVRIRDHAKFADKWNAAREDLGFTELSSEEQDGFVVQRLGGLVAATAAYGPELLVIGYGRDVREQVDAWIAKAKDGAWTTSKPAMPQGLSRAAPDGCNGTAEGQVAMVLGQIVGSMGFVQSITGDTGQGFDWQQVDVEAVQQLLKEHNLDIARSLTGYRDGWWRMRVFW